MQGNFVTIDVAERKIPKGNLEPNYLTPKNIKTITFNEVIQHLGFLLLKQQKFLLSPKSIYIRLMRKLASMQERMKLRSIFCSCVLEITFIFKCREVGTSCNIVLPFNLALLTRINKIFVYYFKVPVLLFIPFLFLYRIALILRIRLHIAMY